MPTESIKLSPSQIDALYSKLKPFAKKESKPQYTLWQIRTDELNVAAYQSGKVVISGKEIDWLVDDLKAKAKADASLAPAKSKKALTNSFSSTLYQTYPQAGSDEVGNGDYLGPFVVAGVIIDSEETAKKVEALQVADSKAMSDEAILKVASKLMELVPYSVQILTNVHYNEIYDPNTRHLNYIKAMMHNQTYLNLLQKGYTLPSLCVIDQFCTPKRYFELLRNNPNVYRNLHFETKAESHFIAVAAASVIARYHFLQVWQKMEVKYGMTFAKGGGNAATKSAQEFIDRYGRKHLNEVAKLHFVNTSRLH